MVVLLQTASFWKDWKCNASLVEVWSDSISYKQRSRVKGNALRVYMDRLTGKRSGVDYVQSDISADVVYGNVSCVPTRTGQWTEAGPHPGMVTIWLSQSIPNCLLNSAHKGNLVQFTVSKDIPSLTNYLKTSCSLISVCIGKFFTKLKKEYPNKFVDLHFHTFQAPVLQMTSGQTLINTTFAVDLHINPREQNPDVLARLILTSNAVIEPFINGTKLVANINGTTVEAKEDFSKIGDVSKLFLSMFDKIFTVTSNVIVEALLHNGIPLPIIDNVTIANTTEIHLFDEYVRLNIDFEYE